MGHSRDGRFSKDPPGDQSFYIIPGDTNKENYRATTFKQFQAPVDHLILAKHGFYYLGYKDRVRCFSCSFIVDDWERNDEPSDAKWHAPNCPMVSPSSMPSSNIPLPRPFTPLLLLILRSIRQTNALESEEFPCQQPHTPEMESSEQRLETFSNGWPQGVLQASVQLLVECGLFYLGDADRTKCFYCGGGLQNWDFDEDPWFEHAKWYPGCEFVLKIKGIEFVRNIYRQFPNLLRPHVDVKSAKIVELMRNGFVVDGSSPSIADVEMGVEQTDPVILDFLENSNIVTTVKDMGFSHADIKEVITRKFRESSDISFTVPGLVEDLMKLGERKGAVAAEPHSPNEHLSIEELQEKYMEKEKEGMCKICFKEPVCVLFMPCGHIASCSNCASDATNCPICYIKINNKINFFRS